MNYSSFLTAISLARRPSPIRKLTDIMSTAPPSMITLATGAPNPGTFPFKEMAVTLRDGSVLNFKDSLMTSALQYGPTQGHPPLVKWLKQLQVSLHAPPTQGLPHGVASSMDLCVTTGSQDGLSKAFEMLLNPGDQILLDSPTYAGTLATLQPMGCKFLDISTDQHGMRPESLKDTLSQLSVTPGNAHPDRPRVLYTIPNGVNPTGASLTLERKKQIYKIAQEHNLIILEDDPYYFLQFTDSPSPSFLSMDTDGRVLRFDSFSKVMSSGMRVGFVTGPQALIERIQLHMQVSVMQTSSFSQVILYQLLDAWGEEGFRDQVQRVSDFYMQQRDFMAESAERWLTGLAEWHVPIAGMFFWIKLLGVQDTKTLIEEKAREKQVLFTPGCAFMSDPSKPSAYVRASYSLASAEDIDKGFERLASVIKDEMRASK